MVTIHEQLSAHYDPAESSDLIDRDIGPQDRGMLEKIIKDFAPKLGLTPVGKMLEPTPVLTAGLAGKINQGGR